MDIKDNPNRVGDPPEYYDATEDTRPEFCNLPDEEQEAIIVRFLSSQPDGEAILREATMVKFEYIAEVIFARGLNVGWII